REQKNPPCGFKATAPPLKRDWFVSLRSKKRGFVACRTSPSPNPCGRAPAMLAYRPQNSAYIRDKVVRQKTTPFPMTNRENVVEENGECNDRCVYENVYPKIFISFHARVTRHITV